MHALKLKAFRSYPTFSLAPDPGAGGVILVGPNGVGKTNLLEALSFFSPGRGFRRARLREVQHDQETQIPWSVSMDLSTETGVFQVGTGRDSMEGEKRVVALNGSFLKTQTELAHHLHVTWLVPQMDRLFWDGNRERRRFLDRLVLGIDPLHGARLVRYEKALRERTHVLQQHRTASDWLSSLEALLVEEGAAITVARLQVVEQLNQHLEEKRHAGKTLFPKARLALVGEVEALFERGGSALQVEEAWAHQLKQGRSLDREKGTTLWGCHRSALQVFHQTRDQRERESSYCSTGEQKTMLISLILAAAALQAATQKPFFLLLDEVVAHLDVQRRGALFDELRQLRAHIWMTGTDAELFKGMDQHLQLIHIKEPLPQAKER
ncbi:MAG: DNA replication/repair protein RecF [Alphaproteobacteria bacterium]